MVKTQNNDLVNTFPEEKLEAMVTMVFIDQLSDQKIAAYFNMSKPTFYKLKKTERFQNALKIHGEIAIRFASAKIQAHSEKAVATLVRLMAEGNEGNQLRAATELLRLAGLNERLPDFTVNIQSEDHRGLIKQYITDLVQTNE